MEKIEYRSLNDCAYDKITEGMISGRFLPGQPLVIRTLAEAYGISTTPIREALQRLLAERRLEVLPNRSIVVPEISSEKYIDLLRIRCALEGLAGELAASDITAADLTRLRNTLQDIERAIKKGDSKAYVSANQKFHFMIYKKANSPYLLQMIQDLWSRVGPLFNSLFTDPNFISHANTEHENIYEALSRRDGQSVREHIVNDINVAAKALLPQQQAMPTRAKKALGRLI
ncbi:MAG: GntR family transcriptional regulator [Gallionella sp.]|nr:GntR family transcriptional regulator [Gallionella sp.]